MTKICVLGIGVTLVLVTWEQDSVRNHIVMLTFIKLNASNQHAIQIWKFVLMIGAIKTIKTEPLNSATKNIAPRT